MKRLIAVCLAVLMALSCFAVAEDNAIEVSYTKAKGYFAEQDLDAAYALFKSLGAYGSAPDYCEYIEVIKMGLEGMYVPAAATINNLYSELDNADDYVTFFMALEALDKGDLVAAEELLENIEDFFAGEQVLAKINDSYAQQVYAEAEALIAAGDWDGAMEVYKLLEDGEMMRECTYRHAQALEAEDNFAGACGLYMTIIGYKDSAERYSETARLAAVTEEYQVGNTVIFGSYIQSAQDGAAREPVEWLVLDVKDGKALLISKYALDCQVYAGTPNYPGAAEEPSDDEFEDGDFDDSLMSLEFDDEEFGDDDGTSPIGNYVSWRSSTLRAWLNGSFINSAFNASERALIASTEVKAERNPSNFIDPGYDTVDKIFVLSISELNDYFMGNDARKCVPTSYAQKRGAGVNDNGNCWYWTRNPGQENWFTVTVLRDGSFGLKGVLANTYYIGVRPAMWVNIY